MGSPPEGPNPLRPYYIPPSIGLPVSPSHVPAGATSGPSGAKFSFGSSARDVLPDLDYSDYLGDSSPSISELAKDILDKALWKYSSVLMAQPFEVAKTILQVYVPQDVQEGMPEPDERRRWNQGFRENYYEDDSAHSSDDESNYFTSAAPLTPSSSVSRNRRPARRVTDRSGYIPQSSVSPRYTLKIKNPSSLFDVLSQLWTTSGPTSLWKATNSTFIYGLLFPTLNTFIRSLLSAIVGLPEEGLSLTNPDILTSTSPTTTLVLTGIASALSSILLSPIDTTRTYLILTPPSHGPRSLLRAMRLLPTPNYFIPPHLIPITVLSSTLPNLLSASTPLFLKSYFSLDPVLNPSAWSICTFLASSVELGLRFPLETVLRRAQIATFMSPALRQQSIILSSPATQFPVFPTPAAMSGRPTGETLPLTIETIIPTPRSYRGIVGTIWSIIYEEGTDPSLESETVEQLLGRAPRPPASETSAASRRERKRRRGQGVQGLYRGWRLGMWGLIGVWGTGFLAAALGAGEDEMIAGAAGARMAMGAGGGQLGRGTGKGAF